MADRTLRAIITGDNSSAIRAFSEVGAAADASSAKISSNTGKMGSAFSKLGKYVLEGGAAVAVAASVYSVKAASSFQGAMTTLVTGAGESQKNLKTVSDGILNMAVAVGQTPQALASGMYLIESAGYHGAAGLKVLKAAAEGAATGNAQLATVAGAVTTAMHDYSIPTSKANAVTSALIETVASGKTTLDDLGGSLGKVLPQAAALGISLPDVAGAMATMTNAGLSARLASQHLSNTLLAISAPGTAASAAMTSVGLTSQQVKNALDGPGGLGAALQLIEQHVGSTFPAGSVASVNAFKAIMGGATGYSTALMLTGANAKTFADDTKKIGGVLGKASSQVQGFGLTQKDLEFKLKQVRVAVDVLEVRFGSFLIPKLEQAGQVVMGVVKFFERHKVVAEALAVVIGTVLVAAIGSFIATTVAAGAAALAAIAPATAFGAAMGAAALGIDAAAAPIAAIIAAVALLGVGIYELVEHWSTVWGEIKRIASTVWSGIKSGFDDFLNFVKQWGPIVGEVLLAPFTLGMSLILPEVISHWSDIASFFEGIPDKIEGFFAAAGSWLLKAGKDIVGGLLTGLEYVTPEGWVVKYHTQILNALKDAGQWLVSVGEAIIDGLLKGLQDAWHKVTGWVSSAFGWLVGHAKSAVGAHSPSTVFAEIGANIMQGLAIGISGNAGLAHSAISNVASSLASTKFSAGSVINAVAGTGGGTSNPYAIGGGSGGGGATANPSNIGSGDLHIELTMNGQQFSEAILQDFRTVALRSKRATVNLGLS